MELVIEENMNNTTNMEINVDTNTNINTNINTNYKNTYQPIQQTPKTPKKKKVTYEQILESMNMKVVDGKLVMTPPSDSDNLLEGKQPQKRWNKKVNTSIPAQYSYQNNQYPIYKQEGQQQQEEEKKPLTFEQYKRLLWMNEMKRRQDLNHIRQVKSTKLFFSTPSTNETNTGNIIYSNQSRVGYNMFKLK
jgi:hypothetical protein